MNNILEIILVIIAIDLILRFVALPVFVIWAKWYVKKNID